MYIHDAISDIYIVPCADDTISHIYIVPGIHDAISHIYIVPCVHDAISHIYIVPCLHAISHTMLIAGDVFALYCHHILRVQMIIAG